MSKTIRLLCLLLCTGIMAGAEDAPTVKDLIHQLKSNDVDKKEHAAQLLGEMGPDAEPAIGSLLDALNDDLPYVRIHCAQALAKIGTPALPALIKAMKNVNVEVRTAAATALGNLGANDEAASSALTAALHDHELQVRSAAASSLGTLGTHAQSATPSPLETTKQKPAVVAPVEPPSPPVALTPLRKPVTRPAPPKKKLVPAHPKMIKKTKLPPPPPVPTPEELLVQLQTGGVPVSTGTQQAIIQRSSETAPLLILALQAANTTTAELSAGLLEKIGTDDTKKALNAYRKRQQDKKMIGLIRDLRQEGKTSDEAATALKTLGAPAVVPVSQVLSDPKPASRRAAAKVLNQIGAMSAPATTALMTALDDMDADVRAQSAEALEKINSAESKKALRFFSFKDKFLRLLSIFKH